MAFVVISPPWHGSGPPASTVKDQPVLSSICFKNCLTMSTMASISLYQCHELHELQIRTTISHSQLLRFHCTEVSGLLCFKICLMLLPRDLDLLLYLGTLTIIKFCKNAINNRHVLSMGRLFAESGNLSLDNRLHFGHIV